MSADPLQGGGELQLAPESIEALASRLAEILIATAAPASGERRRPELLTAAEVARWWGIGRRWVYDHADQLGARRLGAGRRPRLRFDPEEVAERLGPPPTGTDARRSEPMRGDYRSDSLSGRSRAMVARQAKERPGRRANAPRPGADVGGAIERVSPESPLDCTPARAPNGQEAGDG